MGCCARSELRTVAPILSPPSGSCSILSRGRRLMSTTCSGRSTFSFIRSSSVVPPATKRTLAPCCAALAVALAAIAADAFSARRNSKVCMAARSLGLAADLLDGRDDIGVGPTPADVAAHGFADIVVLRPAGFLEQRDRGHDLAARAIAALIGVVRDECRLHRMQRAGLSDAFDRRDLVARVHDGQAEAGVHAPAIDMHGAGAALTVVTAFLGAGQDNVFAQVVEQRRPRVEAETVLVS